MQLICYFIYYLLELLGEFCLLCRDYHDFFRILLQKFNNSFNFRSKLDQDILPNVLKFFQRSWISFISFYDRFLDNIDKVLDNDSEFLFPFRLFFYWALVTCSTCFLGNWVLKIYSCHCAALITLNTSKNSYMFTTMPIWHVRKSKKRCQNLGTDISRLIKI